MVVKYVCNDPTRQIVSKETDANLVLTELVSTCLFNGAYDFDVQDFECTECLKRPDPNNGRILCESNKFLAGSTCVLECDPGYIPLGQTLITCLWDKSMEDFLWDIDSSLFICVEPIGLIIGGIAQDYTYLNEIEVLAPNLQCNGQKLTDYPMKVIGASAGFILGQNLVCGGAIYDYTECELHAERSQICDRNVDCIQTHQRNSLEVNSTLKNQFHPCFTQNQDIVKGLQDYYLWFSLKFSKCQNFQMSFSDFQNPPQNCQFGIFKMS